MRATHFQQGTFMMKPWILAGTTAMALLYATGAIQAEVTPEDVWANWKTMAESYGQTLTTASEAREGDTLVVKGLTMAMDQDGAKASGTIDELRFRDLGDGTVEVTSSDTYNVNMDTPSIDTQPAARMAISIAVPGMTTIASGNPDAVSYALDAPEIKLHLEGADATDPSVDAVMLDMALTGATGAYAVAKADAGQKVDYQLAAESADVSMTVKNSKDGTDVALKLSLADLTGTSSGMFLGAEAMQDVTAALKAGFGFNSDFSYGAGSYEMNVVAEGAPTKASGAIGSGNFAVTMDKDKFALSSGSKDVTLLVESAAIPIPDLSGSYGEASFNLLMPLAKSDSPSDFSLGVKLVDLKVSDALWGMIDPGAALPHDPATLIIDTQGTATLTADLTDTGAEAAMGGVPPGLLNSFGINALTLRVAGAEVTGQGSFTFDNSDMETFQGMPAPSGRLELKATGVNGLIDKLVAMGLVPQDQAMQGKMMLGMFAQPGDGEDTLVSTIEFADKKMTINGMEMPMQ